MLLLCTIDDHVYSCCALQAADGRLKYINEALSGIRIIKFYAWEGAFKKMIGLVREKELKLIHAHAHWMLMGASRTGRAAVVVWWWRWW